MNSIHSGSKKTVFSANDDLGEVTLPLDLVRKNLASTKDQTASCWVSVLDYFNKTTGESQWREPVQCKEFKHEDLRPAMAIVTNQSGFVGIITATSGSNLPPFLKCLNGRVKDLDIGDKGYAHYRECTLATKLMSQCNFAPRKALEEA